MKIGVSAIIGFVPLASARADVGEGDVPQAAPPMAPRFNPRIEGVGSKNLLVNASFECGDYMWSSLGLPTGWGGCGLGGLHGTIVADGAWDGNHCLRIDLGPGKTRRSFFDVWPPAGRVQHTPLAANIGWMEVPAGEPLTLSAYLRSSVPGAKVQFMFRFADNALESETSTTHDVAVSEEWARYSVTQTALKQDVCIAIGPDLSAAPDAALSLWMDAVQLEAGASATPFEPREPLEVGFSTQRYGNTYTAGESQALTVFCRNSSKDDVPVTLKLDGEDYFGNPFTSTPLEIHVPSAGAVTREWRLPELGKGHFRGRISWTANGRTHAQTVTWVVIEPYTNDDSPFGLNHPATTVEHMELLSRAGLRWVRNWAVNWDWVEPRQGEVSWRVADEQLDHVAEADMKTLILFPSPSANWASSAPDSVSGAMWHRMAYSPRDPRLLFDFIAAAVERYRDRCNTWEFLNEPLWVPDFCLPKDGGYTVDDYITLLKDAYPVIRAADPDGVVIGGLSIEPHMRLGDEFIVKGGLDHCDVLNLHPYGCHTVPEVFIKHMERIVSLMDDHGGRKPIWATETGYYAVDAKPWEPWEPPAGHFSAGYLLSSERVAADYLVRHAVIMLSHNVTKLFYHEPLTGLVNNGFLDIENPFLGEQRIPKKTFVALSALANRLGPSPQYVCPAVFPEELAGHAEDLLGYVFACGERSVAILWAPKGFVGIEKSQLAPGITAYDVVGNEMERITLGESPVYIVSTSKPASELAGGWFLHPRGGQD